MENQQNKKLRHVAIAGNIGAGKTTLTTQLGQHFGGDIFYEDVDNNPYLDDFYEDMHRWSFNLQVYFLNSRFDQAKKIQTGSQVVIQDRTIYEDANIFAPNLYEMGLMSPNEYRDEEGWDPRPGGDEYLKPLNMSSGTADEGSTNAKQDPATP